MAPAGKTTLRNAGDRAAERVETGVDAAADTASRLGDVAQEHAEDAAAEAGDLYAKSAAGARDALDELPASLSDAAAAGERAILKGRQQLGRGVRQQPVEALLLAGAIGYLVGWATARS